MERSRNLEDFAQERRSRILAAMLRLVSGGDTCGIQGPRTRRTLKDDAKWTGSGWRELPKGATPDRA
jgi:hypothetical protein